MRAREHATAAHSPSQQPDTHTAPRAGVHPAHTWPGGCAASRRRRPRAAPPPAHCRPPSAGAGGASEVGAGCTGERAWSAIGWATRRDAGVLACRALERASRRLPGGGVVMRVRVPSGLECAGSGSGRAAARDGAVARRAAVPHTPSCTLAPHRCAARGVVDASGQSNSGRQQLGSARSRSTLDAARQARPPPPAPPCRLLFSTPPSRFTPAHSVSPLRGGCTPTSHPPTG